MGKIEINIGGYNIAVSDPDQLPVTIDYKLEDEENFQVKKGSEATQITIPASLLNAKPANSYEVTGIEDQSEGEIFKGFQPAVIKHDGQELLVGKAVLAEAIETDRPISYTFDVYGDNNDWIISTKETTLYELLQHINFIFTKQGIIDSWNFDGTIESLPYVFAPARYGEKFADGFGNLIQVPPPVVTDYNMKPIYFRPSISKYWLIFWAFKMAGYRIQSEFLDTPFFRRQVMPWTWGNFLFSDGTRLTNLDFLAKSEQQVNFDGDWEGWVDVLAINDFQNGGFDNNNVYNYNATGKEMVWTYLPSLDYGLLEAKFYISLTVLGKVRNSSRIEVWAKWFKNSQLVQDSKVFDLQAGTFDVGNRGGIPQIVETFLDVQVNAGDRISAKVYLKSRKGALNAVAEGSIQLDQFSLEFTRVTLGSNINFANYTSFKKHKWQDFFRGIIDEFDLSIATDSINKTVVIEPTHEYQLPGENFKRPGFFNGDHIDWSRKQDISKESKKQLYKDYEREVTFRYKEDTQDGLLKKLSDRHQTVIGSSRYVFPDRFKSGKKEVSNRFFSPCVHWTAEQWKSITGTPPTMIALVPENISNTSKDEAQNTFQPKSAYYKGVVNGIGWVFDNEKLQSFPYMFAVNYMPGGHDDPVLSYSDEKIGNDDSGYVVAPGLFRRFFLPRFAIMRNGEWYNTWMNLKNVDVAGELHREFKILRNQRWEIMQINGFNPMMPQSTNVIMRRWVPVAQADADSTFPSEKSVKDNTTNGTFDIKYQQLKALSSDIPK